jgi:hypothetical protein
MPTTVYEVLVNCEGVSHRLVEVLRGAIPEHHLVGGIRGERPTGDYLDAELAEVLRLDTKLKEERMLLIDRRDRDKDADRAVDALVCAQLTELALIHRAVDDVRDSLLTHGEIGLPRVQNRHGSLPQTICEYTQRKDRHDGDRDGDARQH